MNRKGALGEQIDIFIFVIFLAVIALGIAGGIFLFYGEDYDFRKIEAELLNYKIRKCILENEIDEKFFDGFFANCRLNEKVVRKYFIVRICRNSEIEKCTEMLNGELDIGSGFQECFFRESIIEENRAFPRCVLDSFEQEEKNFSIIVGSNQNERSILG